MASFGSEGSSESSDDSDGEGGAHLSDGSSGSESDGDQENYVSFRVSFEVQGKRQELAALKNNYHLRILAQKY